MISDNKRLIKVNASKSRRPHLMQYEPIFWGKNPLENFFDLGGFFRCTKCQRFLINHQGPHTGIKGTFFRRSSRIFKQFSNVRKKKTIVRYHLSSFKTQQMTRVKKTAKQCPKRSASTFCGRRKCHIFAAGAKSGAILQQQYQSSFGRTICIMNSKREQLY